MQHIYYDYLFHIKNVKTPTVLIIKILIHIKFIPTLFIYIMTITCMILNIKNSLFKIFISLYLLL